MNGSQRGVALLSVLIVVVLISALAFQLYSHQTVATAQTRLALEGTQLREWLLAGETYATALLSQDATNEDSQLVDTHAESWSVVKEVLKNEYSIVSVRIVDSTSRFNLNSVAIHEGSSHSQVLLRLLTSVGLNAEYAAIWRDWVDTDDVRYFAQGYQGREDLDWLGNVPSFRTANSPAADLSEFRMIANLDSTTYNQLSELATVLPTTKAVLNLNTAPAVVLNLLLEPGQTTMPSQDARREFESVDKFIRDYPSFGPVTQMLSVRSEYFEVQSVAFNEDSRMDMTSKVARDFSTGEVRVYARSFGVRHGWYTQQDS